MEARGYSRLHYIQTIKNGSIVKIMNVGKRRKPALVFKKVKDIYEADDSKNPHLLMVRQKKDDFMRVFNGGDRFEGDRSRSYNEERSSIKIESDDQKDDDSDDQNCDKMTLNELMGMARSKISPNNCGPNGNNDDYQIDSGSEDLDCDKMTLSQLKVNARRNKRKLPSYVDLIKPDGKICSPLKEAYPKLSLMNDGADLEMPLSYVKLKPFKKKLCISNCVPSSSESTTTVSGKTEGILTDQGNIHFSGHNSSAINFKIEAIEPAKTDCQSTPCLTDDSFVSGDKEVDSFINNTEMIETAGECALKSGELVFFTERFNCLVNEMSYDHLDCPKFGSITDVSVTDTGMETVKVNDLGMNIQRSLIFPLSELSEQEKGSEETQEPNISVNNSLHCSETIDQYGMFFSGIDKDHLCCKLNSDAENCSMSKYSSPTKSSPCLVPGGSLLDHLNADSTTVDMKQVQSCDISDELSTPDLASICDAEVQHPPERLLSNRKAISPVSQEMLCKRMSDCGVQGDNIEQLECRENLCFENEKETHNMTSPKLDGSKSYVNAVVKVSTSYKQTGLIKSYSRGPILKGSPKVHPLSHGSTKWTSIRSSRSAIAFSERQMQDIESVAMKLRKELNSMKDIVEDALHNEAYLSTSLKYNADKVKSSMDTAKKVDKTAKKCLTIMARDCSRFCKIMTLTDNENASSDYPVVMRMKKVTFADEAGGELCHVKDFDKDSITC